MPLRMRRWIGVTAAGLALVAVWRLPPESFPARGSDVRPVERERYEALTREFRDTGEILRRVLWADSLSTLTVRGARDGVTVTSGPVTETDDQRIELTDDLERLVRSEIAALPRRAYVVFGYIVQRADHGRIPDMAAAGRARIETYAGTVDRVDYCMQVRVTSQRQESVTALLRGDDAPGTTFRSGTLGPCRFYLAHGLPGAGVARWLQDAGIRFALADEDGASGVSDGAPDSGDGSSADSSDGSASGAGFANPGWLDEQLGRRRSVFGYAMPSHANRPIEADRCLAGYADACRYLFENPVAADPVLARHLDVVRRSPATSIGTGSSHFVFTPDEDFLLSDLQAEFGAEAFRRFWTAEDEEVGIAFERAFGVDPGSWILSWIGRSLEIEAPGPALPRTASTGATLAIVLLLGLAYLSHRQRSVA